MSDYSSPEQAIKQEFETYYLADELEEHWVKDIPNMAAFTANKFRLSVGDNQISETIEILRAMRDDFEHPLVQSADLSSFVEWQEEPEEWKKFQMLLDGIIASLTLSE
jgi:hypothetical protein